MKNLFLIVLFSAASSFLFSQNHALDSVKNPGEILWFHTVSGTAVDALSPVLTPDENILWLKYKTAGVPDSELFCYSPDGDTIWTRQFPDRIETEPMVVPQTGWIMLASSRLLCLNADGSERWSMNMPAPMNQSPAIDTSLNLYIAAGTKLISYDSAGVFRWEYNSPVGEISTPLSVSRTGVVYFGTEFDKLIAVQNTGTPLFINNLFGYVRGAPTIDFDGTIYMSTSNVNTNQSKIEVFNPDGSFVWEMTFYEPNPSAVIIGDSNFIYVRTMNFWGGGFGELYKINKTVPSVQWNFPYGPGVSGAWDPSLSQDGTIYLALAGNLQGRFVAIDNQGNIKWELNPMLATGIDMSPMYHVIIGKEGNVYAVGKLDFDSTFLIAIEAPDAILANTAWPMYKHDQHFTALASNIINPQPNLVADQLLIDFGYLDPGNSSMRQLAIYNTGNLPLTLDWLLESEVFDLEISKAQINNNYTGEIIEAGDSLCFDIGFSPVDTAMYSDTLFLMSNDPDQPLTQIALKGKSTIEGEIKWKIQLSDHLTGPAIDDFGNVYIAGDNKVWRIRPSGTIDWQYEPKHRHDRSDYANITIAHNNRFIYLPWGQTILAIDSAGNEQWNFDPPANDRLYPVSVNEAGHLFFSESSMNGGGHVYCLNQQGEELWNNNIGYFLGYPPAIDLNGNIVSGGNLGSLAKIFSLDNTTGNTNWEKAFFPTSPASIGFNNGIYFGGRWGSMGNYLPKVRAYTASGTLNWEFSITDEFYEISSSIVCHPNRSLIFATSDFFFYGNGTICALDDEGSLLWEKQYDARIFATPAIADNGLIYFGSEDGYFYALYPDGSEKWSLNTESEIYTSPAIESDGTIYFTTEDGFLYAVYGENGGLAHSPWPMMQHDPKHTSAADSLSVFIREAEYPSSGLNNLSATPNPFNHKTTIQWSANYAVEAKIRVFDLDGNLILSQNVACKNGVNQYVWDGSDAEPGVYICTLLCDKKSSRIKVVKF